MKLFFFIKNDTDYFIMMTFIEIINLTSHKNIKKFK